MVPAAVYCRGLLPCCGRGRTVPLHSMLPLWPLLLLARGPKSLPNVLIDPLESAHINARNASLKEQG